MGRVTAIVAVLALGAGVATVWLPPLAWMLALYLCLMLLALTLLSALGWWLKTGLDPSPDMPTWAIWSVGVSAAVLAASFILGPGAGRVTASEHVTIDLPRWALSAAGLAAALACVGYGGVLARADRRWLSALGTVALAVGILAVQPVLRAFGLPYLGPLGAGIVVVVTLVAVLVPGRRRDP